MSSVCSFFGPPCIWNSCFLFTNILATSRDLIDIDKKNGSDGHDGFAVVDTGHQRHLDLADWTRVFERMLIH